MKKFIVIAFLLIIAAVIAYFTFVIATLKIAIGGILLGISVIALIATWVLWKIKD